MEKLKVTSRSLIEQVQHEEQALAKRVTLVDQFGGFFDSVIDGSGKRRLTVDAAISIVNPVINVDLDADTGDNIAISRHQLPFIKLNDINKTAAQLSTTVFTEIFTFTSADDALRLRVMKIKADTLGVFRAKKNSDIIDYFITSPTERNCKFEFLEDLDLPSGDIVSVEFLPERLRLTNFNFFTRVEGYLDT